MYHKQRINTYTLTIGHFCREKPNDHSNLQKVSLDSLNLDDKFVQKQFCSNDG